MKVSEGVVVVRILVTAVFVLLPVQAMPAEDSKQLLWGDTHLHTSYSFDAFLNGNMTADPDVAYRYAKGQPVIHPYHRARVQIGTPLDFLVVSDHAEFLGGIRDIYYHGIQDEDPSMIERLLYWYNERRIRGVIDGGEGPDFFRDLLPVSEDPRTAAATWRESVGQPIPGADVSVRNAWKRIAEIADVHNQPGEFTALIGWEWSAVPGGANLHRVVVTDADSRQASGFVPFASTMSPYPEDLWAWLDQTASASGVAFVAIPHNSNLSKGMMFDDATLRGESLDSEYAEARRRWETVVEITQIKGDSETHPELSPDDEFADFETFPYYLQQFAEPYRVHPADYVRSALKTGLVIESKLGINPFRFGFIGSTDSHTALSSAEEPNFWGKMARDSIPDNKRSKAIADGPTGWSMSASGLAAVWAQTNTRSDIVAALKRREVYATTGPRIRVRLFGGWGFTPEDLADLSKAAGAEKAVPMGGELNRNDAGLAPTFLVMAMKDPKSANLDRIQIVKGWLDSAGVAQEKVFDVAWSGDRELDASGNLESVGDTVDRSSATYTNDIGSIQLEIAWTDPEFTAEAAAFYYVRVLEIPTPRHALMDAIALGLEAPSEGPSVIQERAYTSPIWYVP